jgi:hypothetical protein
VDKFYDRDPTNGLYKVPTKQIQAEFNDWIAKENKFTYVYKQMREFGIEVNLYPQENEIKKIQASISYKAAAE